MLQRCVKSLKSSLFFFFEYNNALFGAILWAYSRETHGQAADDEPLSHADKARGVSCKVQSSEYTPLYNRGFKKSSAVKRTIQAACYPLQG
jgi:hypothetical protein